MTLDFIPLKLPSQFPHAIHWLKPVILGFGILLLIIAARL